MERKRMKLGDVIDDYCTRCRLLMNHGIVGMVGEEIGKVRCLTCKFEHPYRRARLPKKRGQTKALFEQVRQSISTDPPVTPRASTNSPPVKKEEDPDDSRPAETFPREPRFRKPRSHSLAAQRGVQKGTPFGKKKGGKETRRR